MLQHIRAGVLPDQKSPGAPMDAPALAPAAVPQVHTSVAVPRLPEERTPRHGGRAEPAQAPRIVRHLPQLSSLRAVTRS